MGLIKASLDAVSSGFGDQFKEFITCPTIEQNVLIQRGVVSHGKGNSNPTEGVISNGSAIAVPQGMAMMIIDNGAIKEFTAEPGTYNFDTSSEPSIFTGGLGKGIIDTIKTIGSRITFGGQAAKDQRVYYVNLLKIPNNRFGSPQPKKITDDKYGMLEVTFNGEYVFQVVDPALLVNAVVGGNPKDTITYDEIIGDQLRSKFIEKLTYAITVVMRKNRIPFGDIGMYGTDISSEMNTSLNDSWRGQYGLEITDVAIKDINLTDESMARVSKIDDATIFSNPNLQSGLMASASADAMKAAASNESGAMMGFMGMGMAQNTGATMMGAVNQNVAAAQPAQPAEPAAMPEPGTIFAKPEVKEEQPTEPAAAAAIAFCPNCGEKAVGKFCTRCGSKISE
ncbi:MAG TPA: SPFH domain-containing protein [Bacilli bacterium]|nr:SPFH domain-containing protein [Bacilli bacterium]